MALLHVFLASLLFLAVTTLDAAAASPKAMALRKANDLIEYQPSTTFLSGNFVADEMSPAFIFGAVQGFASSRACPTAWFIEEGEKIRLANRKDPAAAVEYTLYLEEDCPTATKHYVFVDQSFFAPEQWPQQWFEWRRKFQKNKAEGEYGATKAKLEKAIQDGAPVVGELRFLLKDGELQAARPEDALRGELKFAPIYDLGQGKKLAQ